MQGLIGSHVEHSDLEPQASKARLAWRAFVSCHSHPCEGASLPLFVQGLLGASVHSSIQGPQVLPQ